MADGSEGPIKLRSLMTPQVSGDCFDNLVGAFRNRFNVCPALYLRI